MTPASIRALNRIAERLAWFLSGHLAKIGAAILAALTILLALALTMPRYYH